jgi:hypothetical protein
LPSAASQLGGSDRQGQRLRRARALPQLQGFTHLLMPLGLTSLASFTFSTFSAGLSPVRGTPKMSFMSAIPPKLRPHCSTLCRLYEGSRSGVANPVKELGAKDHHKPILIDYKVG